MSLRTVLLERTGLDLSAADVERAVRDRMGRLGLADRPSYSPAPGSDEFDALLDLLVVPESWLFRDPAVFDEALRSVRERLAARPDTPVRILSLPCAGGEEAYSMAMLLAQSGIAPSQCRIDAVDLSPAAIARARQGRYTKNAFRSADLAFRARWFTRDGDEHVIDAGLREYVCFSQGNLFTLEAGAGYRPRGRYDLVFCRNLLIYFDDTARLRAARVLAGLLADDGLLLSGFAEAPFLCAHGFGVRTAGAPFALRKGPAVRPLRARTAMSGMPSMSAPAAAPRPTPRQFAWTHERATDALLAQARGDADAGRLAEAAARCDAVLHTQPGCAEAYYLLGLVSECAGREADAERHWQRCLYLDPDHYAALCGLALLHERRGDAARGAGLRQRAARVFARRGSTSE
jgi:chemotaxis protein methyltransferase WspC